MCGENPVVLSTWTRAAGSSPRVRGKRCLFSDGEGVFRLIPAHAGNTRNWASSPKTRRAHPAHAGKTRMSATSRSSSWAHPRACGENSTRLSVSGPHTGSSPRMRGKQQELERRHLHTRLIPAHAGKTPANCLERFTRTAHPRACGENREIAFGNWYEQGSSPRMRGKRGCRSMRPSGLRLIPAHAGKTPLRSSPQPSPPAHPRACGENCPTRVSVSFAKGSSPRMRGKRADVYRLSSPGGLIPAHAGKTDITNSDALTISAHPRACGENALPPAHRERSRGSSPRMRGKRTSPTPA